VNEPHTRGRRRAGSSNRASNTTACRTTERTSWSNYPSTLARLSRTGSEAPSEEDATRTEPVAGSGLTDLRDGPRSAAGTRSPPTSSSSSPSSSARTLRCSPSAQRGLVARDRGSVAVAAVVFRLRPVCDRPRLAQRSALSFYIEARTTGIVSATRAPHQLPSSGRCRFSALPRQSRAGDSRLIAKAEDGAHGSRSHARTIAARAGTRALSGRLFSTCQTHGAHNGSKRSAAR
jgi:hypothetical protein